MPLFVSGGTVSTNGTMRVHTFTTIGTHPEFTNLVAGDITILVVGGGGGGGSAAAGDFNPGGGGGGGEVLFMTMNMNQGFGNRITIGAGGAVDQKGGNTSVNFIPNPYGELGGTTVYGGGAGGNNVPGAGGSGGGAGRNHLTGGAAVKYNPTGMVNIGGVSISSGTPGAAGGGGATQSGRSVIDGAGANGGTGYTTNISGTNRAYGAGGGGGARSGGTGSGGAGGNTSAGTGGDAIQNTSVTNGTAGAANRGGGGGGAAANGIRGLAGAGGSGTVVISYLPRLPATGEINFVHLNALRVASSTATKTLSSVRNDMVGVSTGAISMSSLRTLAPVAI